MKLLGQVNPNLTPVHKTALEASLKPKIKTLTKESLNDPLVTLLGEACEILGHKANGLVATSILLRDELKNYFTTYTLEEVQAAVRMGVTGKLCDFAELQVPIVSVANICKFINLYNQKVRKEALYEQAKFEEKNNQQEIERKRIAGNKRLDSEISDCLISFRSNPQLLEKVNEQLRACYYRRLKETKGKLLPIELMNEIMAVAEAQIKDFEELGKEQQHALRRRVDREIWDRDRLQEVKTRAQSIALKKVFETL